MMLVSQVRTTPSALEKMSAFDFLLHIVGNMPASFHKSQSFNF
jgi:hypothetical protein